MNDKRPRITPERARELATKYGMDQRDEPDVCDALRLLADMLTPPDGDAVFLAWNYFENMRMLNEGWANVEDGEYLQQRMETIREIDEHADVLVAALRASQARVAELQAGGEGGGRCQRRLSE